MPDSNFSDQGLIAKCYTAINIATERELHFKNPSTSEVEIN